MSTKKARSWAAVLKALRKNDAYYWAIGDALIEECGPVGQRGSLSRLRECAEEMKQHGCDEENTASGTCAFCVMSPASSPPTNAWPR